MSSVTEIVSEQQVIDGVQDLALQNQDKKKIQEDVHEPSFGNHGGCCAICLSEIPLQETAMVKGCEHTYCVTCILRWASCKESPTCPQCKHPFEFLSVHRAHDGSIEDFLFEESVCLLLRASWFVPLDVVEQASYSFGDNDDFDIPCDYEDEDDDLDEFYLHGSSVRIGNRRWGGNGFVRSGRQEARPVQMQMSGGQKQRIAIARAIIKSPTILLLDEATSALDSESERVVQEALENASIGRTTILIAHRLSTIRNADVISVVQNGHVVETGSHDDLMENIDGQYASLVRLQQIEKQDSDVNINVNVQMGPISDPSKDLRSSHRVSTLSRSSSANSFTGSSTVKNHSEDNKPKLPSFKRLLAMNLPEWKQALYGCISATLFGAIQPLYAYALGSMVSVYFLTSHDEIKEKTRIYALSFVGLAVLSFLINISQHYNFAYMGEYLTKRIRERMLSKVLTFEVGWFDRDENSSGAICSRLAKDANVVRSLVGDRMALLIQTISAVAIACTMGLVIAWRLALVMIAVQPVIIVCFYTRRVLLKSMSKKAIKAQDESSKLAAEAVSNVRTITAFSSQERIMEMLKKAQESPRRESIRQSWFAGIGLAMSQSLTSCTWALDFWYGGKLIAAGYITAKALFETFMILVSTGRVIADAGSMTTDLAKGSDAVGSVFAVLDRYTSIDPEDPDGYEPERITGRVEFIDLDFSYPTRPDVTIFKNFSIEIDQGKATAIVGPSGSGKSTIIGLIERFYDPLKGIVKIDGRDIRSYHLRSLRQHIALVSQEPTLFAGTIRENIIYGRASDKIDEAEIIEAAKAANAHDFITSLTDGYDTYCGDRGVQLSGGQKQRIAIARAVLKNPSVLLLDEATSALDSQSERVVQDALERVMVGRTSVVIAHRLSTIQNCDTIAVLDKGKLVERGTHSSLLAKGPTGVYFSLVSLQSTSS